MYVGLLRQVPPPDDVQAYWDAEVFQQLGNHLQKAAQNSELKDREIITEHVLCMAGKECQTGSVTLPPGTAWPAEPVVLRPLVWIHCASKRWKRKVKYLWSDMPFLTSFLKKFKLEDPRISLDAPWPATGTNLQTNNPATETQTIRFSRGIYAARYNVWKRDKEISLESTIGGAIVTQNCLYGLTTAHGIVDTVCEQENRSEDDGTESDDDAESTESDGGPHDNRHESPFATSLTAPPNVKKPFQRKSEIWTDQDLPSVVAYMSRGTSTGDYTFPKRPPPSSDFALVALNKLDFYFNHFYNPIDGETHQISDIMLTSELSAGDVWVTNPLFSQLIPGYLLKEKSCMILRNHVMQTRKIQLNYPGCKLPAVADYIFC